MIVELHVIQSFAPSNLNRDDTGAPKDCDFGGVRRARISSQSLKRAMRRAFATGDLIPADLRATRTKRVVGQIAVGLEGRGKSAQEAALLAANLLDAGGIKTADGQVGALMFLGADEIESLATLAEKHAAALLTVSPEQDDGSKPRGRRGTGAGLPDLRGQVSDALRTGRSVEVALFGRMIAELPEGNVDAAAQVAHAISSHRVELDFDYYTAMDDLATAGETGAAMVDTVEFNAATYYRYLSLDVETLLERLADPERVRIALDAFLRAAISAEPSGKQNSFAAHNPPSYVLAVVRNAGNWSLANSFLRPVRASADRDLVDASIAALETYWGRLTSMYGTGGLRLAAATADRELGEAAGIARSASIDRLVDLALEVAVGVPV